MPEKILITRLGLCVGKYCWDMDPLKLSVFLMVLKTDSSSCKFCCILGASWFQDVQKNLGEGVESLGSCYVCIFCGMVTDHVFVVCISLRVFSFQGDGFAAPVETDNR